jgi:hypothetical protein
MSRPSRRSVEPQRTDWRQFAKLVGEWSKATEMLIAAPLFRGGSVDRAALDTLRDIESDARKRVTDFLDRRPPRLIRG